MMSELTQKLQVYARLLSRAARLALGEPASALLALRMAFWVVALSLLVKLMPLPRALNCIATWTRPARARNDSAVEERLARLLDSVLAADFWVFTPTCWKRAPVLHRYLALNGIESRIVFGVRREGQRALEGHAWLESGGEPLLETNTPDYKVTFVFPT